VKERVPHAQLTLVGEPPSGELPEGARVLGSVQSVAAAIRGAALLVLPSLQEGFGLVVAEALACGVPVVTTPCGGPEELVRASRGGEVLTGFDAEELATTVARLLRDRDGLSRMRASGRAHVLTEHDPRRLEVALAEALEALRG
jgi:glycosyltransferase involved in cell wall biosynthesis